MTPPKGMYTVHVSPHPDSGDDKLPIWRMMVTRNADDVKIHQKLDCVSLPGALMNAAHNIAADRRERGEGV